MEQKLDRKINENVKHWPPYFVGFFGLLVVAVQRKKDWTNRDQ